MAATWTHDSWRGKTVRQAPVYPDPDALAKAERFTLVAQTEEPPAYKYVSVSGPVVETVLRENPGADRRGVLASAHEVLLSRGASPLPPLEALVDAPDDVCGVGGDLAVAHSADSQSVTFSAPSITTTVPTMRSWIAWRFASQ